MAKAETKSKSKSSSNQSNDAEQGTLLFEKNGMKYYRVTASCACGATFETGSTLPVVRVDICSQCHPFFTGEDRLVDSEGRVEKFKKKYNLS